MTIETIKTFNQFELLKVNDVFQIYKNDFCIASYNDDTSLINIEKEFDDISGYSTKILDDELQQEIQSVYDRINYLKSKKTLTHEEVFEYEMLMEDWYDVYNM